MEEEVLLSFEDDVFDFDEKDKRILLCLGTFSVTLKAIRRAGYDKVKNMIWGCVNTLLNNREDLELWIQSKDHEEFLRVCDTKTMKCFIAAVRWFVHDDKATYLRMDIEKGHYNNNDLLYEIACEWVSILIPRYIETSKWLCDIMENTQKEMVDDLRKSGRDDYQVSIEDIINPR
jgi:hypothetical protein